LEEYIRKNQTQWHNPSALYANAVDAYASIDSARKGMLELLHGTGEFVFTSGGTESDNTAIFGSLRRKGGRIILSAGEHDAMMVPANSLKDSGYDVHFAPIKSDGTVDIDGFKALLNREVAFASVMHVSNETGGINDIKKLVRMTKTAAPDAIFHSDGVQAFGKIPVGLNSLGVDLYSVSAHKIHGLKGIGGLYIKKGVRLKPYILGGGQEKGLRSGTMNAPLVSSFFTAATMSQDNLDVKSASKRAILKFLADAITIALPETVVISNTENGAPHILTVAFKDVRGEVLLHSLEKHGIMVGNGSACSSRKESRFKDILGLDDAHGEGIVRFSVSEFTTLDDIKYASKCVIDEVNSLQNFTRK
jgi:cysteine desulfurase